MSEKNYINEFSLQLEYSVETEGILIHQRSQLNYLNSTLANIPISIEQAILKGYFSIKTCGSSNVPAVIGRVVIDIEKTGIHWSVVAVITTSQTNRKKLSSFRFFLCQGDRSLWKILDWLTTHQREKGHLPCFSSSHKQVGDYIIHNVTHEKQVILETEDLKQVRYSRAPVLLDPKQDRTLQQIHEMATLKAQATHQPIAWAHHIEVPRTIEQFQVISFCRTEACQQFQQDLTAPIANVIYQAITPQLSQLSQEFIQQEIKIQIEYEINKYFCMRESTTLSSHLSRVVIMRFTAQELIEIYNHDSSQLFEYINEVSLTPESIGDYRKPIVLEIKQGGNYWVVFGEIDNDLSPCWLVPKRTLKITPQHHKDVVTRLFDCNNYYEKVREFYLIEPAKVILQSNGATWKLVQKGKLSFRQSS